MRSRFSPRACKRVAHCWRLWPATALVAAGPALADGARQAPTLPLPSS